MPDLLSNLRRRLPSRASAPEPDAPVRVRAAKRLASVGVVILLGLAVVSARAGWLMLVPNERLERMAQVQFEQSIEVLGRRGELLDRNGTRLATTVALRELHADPSRLDDTQRRFLAKGLAPLLEQTEAHVLKRLSRSKRQDVLLARDLTPDEAGRMRAVASPIVEKDHKLRNVLWTRDIPRRFYPGGTEAAPLLGLVGHDGHGLAGLESTLDELLRGRVFKYVTWRDRKGRRVTPFATSAKAGTSVMLTIDRRIQHSVEETLDETMERTGAKSAFAVVVDVRTGDLLALGNRPTANTNDTTVLNLSDLKNRAAMNAFEPGSVFKPFMAAAALEEGLVTPETVIECEGGAWRVGRSIIHDDHPKGDLSVSDVIKYSSNIGAAKLAFMLEDHRTIAYLRDFGFGRYTGLKLPGETRGAMQKAGNIKPIELATTAYGHGVTSNAIQLAYGVATLANGGVRMEPRLIKALQNEYGEVIHRSDPEVDRRVVSAETASAVLDMMLSVTEEGGTGTRARVEGYEVAGKTGTAWKHIDGAYSSTDRIGSFVGTLPADDPRVAIVVVVDTPTIGLSYGGVVAGPGFAQIGAETMRILGVPPTVEPEEDDSSEDEEAEPTRAERLAVTAAPELQWSPTGELRVPNLTGLSMRDALVTLQGAGLTISTHGSGRVSSQIPAPGGQVASGAQVEVTLQ
jgi:cell division protein FtsI (penicillin-binding protein 3)